MERSGHEGRKASGLIRVYAWMMLLTTALALAAAAYVTHTSRAYQATSELVVQPEVSRSGAFLSPAMPTEQRIVTSGSVVRPVALDLGLPSRDVLAAVHVTVPVDTNVIEVTYSGATPRAALRGARSFTEHYLHYRNPQSGRPAVVLTTPAELPSAPVAPDYALVFGISLAGGLVLGFGAAYAWDRLRGRLRTVADVKAHTGLDVLASVPRFSRRQLQGEPFTPRAAATFDQLVARIPGLLDHRHDFAVLVTGATPGTGVSTVAAETALALTRLGRRVVLVGSYAGEGTPLPRGGREDAVLSHTLTGHTLRESGVPGLRLADPGWPAPGGTAGPSLDALDLLVRTLTLDSIVVIDGPPADRSGALCFVVDRVVLAVDLHRGMRASATEAVEALTPAGDKLVGVVTTMPARRTNAVRPETPTPETAAVTRPVPPEGRGKRPSLDGALARRATRPNGTP